MKDRKDPLNLIQSNKKGLKKTNIRLEISVLFFKLSLICLCINIASDKSFNAIPACVEHLFTGKLMSFKTLIYCQIWFCKANVESATLFSIS